MANKYLENETKFREAVRNFLRDLPIYNTLLGGYETENTNLDVCVELALSDFNETAPRISNYTVKNFPSFVILLYGTVIQVLISAGILQSRNDLNYSAGGVTVQISDKAGQYRNWLDFLIRQYQMMKTNLKIQLNMDQAWGSVPSEYSYIDYYDYGWGPRI